MTTLREAAQQALEALEDHAKQYPHMQKGYTVDAITALKAALEQPEQEQAEPVAWMVYTLDGKSVCVTDNPADFAEGHRALPLYTHPPRREWQSLTEEEIRKLTFHNQRTLWPRPDRSDVRATAIPFARAVEQALKERNNG